MSESIRYSYTLASYQTDQLQGEVTALAIANFLGLAFSGQTVEALFAASISPADKTRLDAVMAAHVVNPNFETVLTRSAAQTLLAASDPILVLQRSVLLAILDQLNVIRAALPTPLAAITIAQAKAAVSAKAQSGLAD